MVFDRAQFSTSYLEYGKKLLTLIYLGKWLSESLTLSRKVKSQANKNRYVEETTTVQF